MNCPKCGSTRLRRSHSRNFKERLRKLFNQRAWRCIDCNWRGILKSKSSRTKPHEKEYILVQITMIIITIITIIAVYLIIKHLL